MEDQHRALSRVTDYARTYRDSGPSIHALASAEDLRRAFCRPLNDQPVDRLYPEGT
ncbi:MAG: hypothetical protein AAGJ29_01735 [Pseudomonadota bacterium]